MKRECRSVFFILALFFIFNYIGVVSSLSVVVHVPEKYVEVSPGDRVYFEVDIKYPENYVRKDLGLEYTVFYEGDVFLQSKVLKAVETQASFLDFLIIPEGAKTGRYVLNVGVLDYEDLDEEVEASFYVIPGTFSEFKIYFFILFGIVVFLVLIVFFRISIRRNKENKLELDLFD